MKKNVAIVHYNTPELTEAAILSVKKHGGEDYMYYVLDNSDKRPFVKEMENVKVFDNTQGQIIDFEKELAKYPDKEDKIGCASGCVYGSDKHMMSVQTLWDLVPDGFLLLDSDILVKQNIDFMFMPDQCAAGHVIHCGGPWRIERLAPMLCWLNVPVLRAAGAVYFDPNRAWALHEGMMNKRNFWDTGAALLDDIRSMKPQLHGKRVDIRNLMVHYGHGSWKKNSIKEQQEWLDDNKSLWYMNPAARKPKYTVLTYIFGGYENVHEIQEKDKNAEYILVTDDPALTSDTWEVVYDGGLVGKPAFEQCYQVRFHPFKYAHTDTVVRVDGSIKILKSLKPLLDTFLQGGYDRCLMIHPKRNTMPAEYEEWVTTRGYPREQADRCLSFMERMGYDLNTKGLFQGCFEIVRKSKVNTELNNLTFDLLRYLGQDSIERIDQTVFSFVVNHMYSDRLKVMPVPDDVVSDGRLMQWYHHKSNKKITVIEDKIPPVMFGKIVTYDYEQVYRDED